MDEKICAVVVTYNRKRLLIECLEAIRKQTKPVDAIYIIDNASTDGTPELLKEKGYIQKLPATNLNEPYEKTFGFENLTDGAKINVHYVRMHINTGGAGGFFEGVKRAYEKGYDWFWLMDDDGIADAYCLEKLIYVKKEGYMLSPIILDVGKKGMIATSFCDIKTGGSMSYDLFLSQSSDVVLEISYSTFNGILIKRRVVSSIGFPKKEMFIWGDDTEYVFRAIKKGFKLKLVINAKFYHPPIKASVYRILFGKVSLTLSDEWGKNYFSFRNKSYNFCRYDLRSWFKHVFKYLIFFVFYRELDLRYLKLFIIATIDGVRGNFERRIGNF